MKHALEELFQQRMLAIACGDADGNDAAALAHDPLLELLVGREPIDGQTLASQPPLSRFENGVGRRELLRLSESLAEAVIERHTKRKNDVRLITIDLDPTHDAAHGGRQLTFFNGDYDSGCYLPLARFLTFDDEVEQYLWCYVLRAGNAPAKRGCIGLLERLLPRLRKAFPKARIRVRLDGAFAGPERFEFFAAQRLEYVVAMGKNAVLETYLEPLMVQLRQDVEACAETVHCYGECQYRAQSWDRERRVIFKAELTCHPDRDPKDNPRFVVTNLEQSPQWIYEAIYCARGDVENRIKELEYGLEIDRTRCTSFMANQFRVLMTAAPYLLMQELRLRARATRCARAQLNTRRLRLLKFGAWIESSVRRIVLHLPMSTAYAYQWQRIARSLGAVAT